MFVCAHVYVCVCVCVCVKPPMYYPPCSIALPVYSNQHPCIILLDVSIIAPFISHVKFKAFMMFASCLQWLVFGGHNVHVIKLKSPRKCLYTCTPVCFEELQGLAV